MSQKGGFSLVSYGAEDGEDAIVADDGAQGDGRTAAEASPAAEEDNPALALGGLLAGYSATPERVEEPQSSNFNGFWLRDVLPSDTERRTEASLPVPRRAISSDPLNFSQFPKVVNNTTSTIDTDAMQIEPPAAGLVAPQPVLASSTSSLLRDDCEPQTTDSPTPRAPRSNIAYLQQRTETPASLHPTRSEISTPLLPSVDFSAWGPPPPTAAPPQSMVDAVQRAHVLKRGGRSVNRELRKTKDFNNPDILDKLVKLIGIDDCGSNFPTHLFDPHSFKKEDYYDELGPYSRQTQTGEEGGRLTQSSDGAVKAQDEYYKRLQASQSKRSAIDFSRGAAGVNPQGAPVGGVAPNSVAAGAKLGPAGAARAKPK